MIDMKASEDMRSLQLTLGVYLFIFAAKLAIYFLSGVVALYAVALHTLSDIFISGFLLVAAWYSRKVADKVHMFGYGRAQNVAALVAATLFISFTSFELYREAIPRLFRHEESKYQSLPLVLGVLALSMLIAAAPLYKLFTQKTRGAAARAQLTELVNDELGLLAAFVGTLFIVWGYPIADPLAAILVATIIAYNAIRLFSENTSFLLGRSPGSEFLGKLERQALTVPGVLSANDLRAEYIGPDNVHVDLHIEVQRGTPIEQANRIAHEVEARLHADLPGGLCMIHVDPAEEVVSNPDVL